MTVDDAARTTTNTKGDVPHERCTPRGAATASHMMLLVSGSTATVRRLAAANRAHLGHLLTPSNRNAASVFDTGLAWACDNGCYRGLDAPAFRRLLARVKGRPGCLWVVCPDRVADASETLRLFTQWAAEVRAAGHPVAFVGQDGAENSDIPWAEFDCWFVGGSTSWKLSRASADLMHEARRRGKRVHVGRVNSLRRMTWAFDSGADSVDGSSMSMFGDHYIAAFCAWSKRLASQPVLFGRD
jgi:hypothetical protein